MLKLLGYGCYAFGIADVAFYVLGIADLTGVLWSPIVAFILGSVFMKMDGGAEAS